MNGWGAIARIVDKIPHWQKNSQQHQSFVPFTISLNRYCVFCDLKLDVYWVENDGEFNMFE
jgi:hypothetical protein